MLGHVVADGGTRLGEAAVVDLEGRVLMPGLLNGHDVLDHSALPPLGEPPYPSLYAWGRDADESSAAPAVASALGIPLPDRIPFAPEKPS